MRRQDNQRDPQRFSGRNNDWNRTNEHFSSERDVARSSRADEYDRYAYHRNNDHSMSSDYGNRSQHYHEVDSPDARDESHSFYHNNAGNYPMENSRYDNFSGRGMTGHYGKGPKGWKRSDERIKEEVCELLYRDQHIDASNIEVMVNDGVVTLSGTIDSRWSKRHAEERLEHLSGVEDIHNELRIDRFESSRFSS